jgi:hypothetical protein
VQKILLAFKGMAEERMRERENVREKQSRSERTQFSPEGLRSGRTFAGRRGFEFATGRAEPIDTASALITLYDEFSEAGAVETFSLEEAKILLKAGRSESDQLRTEIEASLKPPHP